jgi:hypothetical protein
MKPRRQTLGLALLLAALAALCAWALWAVLRPELALQLEQLRALC